MKLIVPMSGLGNRFLEAGYTSPKPLIVVEGKPIIAHVLDMFPGLSDITFICHEGHLSKTPMQEILTSLCPTAKIISIESKKLGPVYALTHAFADLPDDEAVIVSYCDFTQYWDFPDFISKARNDKFAGAVPAYTGFHPHLLRRNLYAGIKADDSGLMTAIQEKHCFTPNLEDSLHSSGIYYFSSGALLKDTSYRMLAEGNTLNGEYYVSMLYPYLLQNNLPVYVPPITHFMQWGTPVDLEEYEAWSRLIHQDLRIKKAHTDIPHGREQFVTIPYARDTIEYKKCYAYWKEVITNKI